MSTRRLSIDLMRSIAQKHGGQCLSPEYKNGTTPLLWECSEGHQWETPYLGCIKKGSWCPVCRDTKNSISDARKIAEEHGGECLSVEYINNYTPLSWRCDCGYEWEAIYANIQQGSWCPYCSYENRDSIETMHAIAADRAGKCLSTKYTSSSIPLLWECSEGHQWKATGRGIKHRTSWCAVCAGNAPKTLSDMQDLAKKRDGKCLSKQYVNVKTHLEWECTYKHKWMSTPGNVQQGRWCPECNSKKNVAECKCREIIEELTGLKFPCTRRMLGNGYELDMYNDKLKLAFEYNGRQHYIFTPRWHKTQSALTDQKKRDENKKKICQEKGIRLEVIHYKISSSDSRLKTFLKDKLAANGISITS